MQVYNAPLRDMRFVMHELHARPPISPKSASRM
jgi:hypothetical protein